MMNAIVGEPMSTIPTSPPLSTSRPSTPILPRPLSPSKSDALKANPHPYPIRTTSTAVLSRSNSTASTVTTTQPHQYQYQYYVPQSPSKESPSSNNPEGKDARRGGRHRHSKSLVNLDSGPKPQPAPSTTTLFSHRNRSTSSLSSSESDSPTKSEKDDLATGNKERGRRCRGGKVRGIVASFEERSGPEDEEGRPAQYRRERTDSDASSVSSASSFGSFTDVKADGDSVKLESELTCFESTPKRNNVENRGTQQRGREEEPTIEELLASTAGDPTPGDAAYDETVKLHSADVVYSTVTASSIRYSLPIPTFSSLATKRNSKSPLSSSSALNQNPNSNPTNPDDELSVDELLALVSDGSAGASTGASAWERDDVGCCTVKRVGDVEGFVDLNAGRREEKKLSQDSAEGPPTSHPPPRQISPTTTTTSERELELVQEMSETREMVRALSTRIASVEAKIGEMEVAAGELEVRGRQLRVLEDEEEKEEDRDHHKPPQGQSLPGRVASTLYRTVFGVARASVQGDGVGASLVRMVLPFSSPPPKSRSRETSRTRAVLPMWYKRSWACYLLFLGLGACAFVLREVVRRGLMLRGRRTYHD